MLWWYELAPFASCFVAALRRHCSCPYLSPTLASTRSAHGWYPAILGPNNAAAKGRIPYTLLMIMDALRMFPGQVGMVKWAGQGVAHAWVAGMLRLCTMALSLQLLCCTLALTSPAHFPP